MSKIKRNKKVLWISFLIIFGYMVIEAIGGFLTNSLALLSDAGHMLNDAISLAIALLAITIGEKGANYSKTYGYRRYEILAAVLNGATLVIIACYIFYEAIQRFQNPPEIASTGMLIIATMGLIINIVVARIMSHGGDVEENLNMKGAYMHVISDMIGSIGAIIAALLIQFWGWGWADPMASVIVAMLVLRSGYKVIKSGLHVLMEGTPLNVDISDVIETIQNAKGIKGFHDLHIWSISSGLNALSCHAVVEDEISIAESECILHQIEKDLEQKNIHHITIQLETSSHRHDDSILCKVKSESGHNHHH